MEGPNGPPCSYLGGAVGSRSCCWQQPSVVVTDQANEDLQPGQRLGGESCPRETTKGQEELPMDEVAGVGSRESD